MRGQSAVGGRCSRQNVSTWADFPVGALGVVTCAPVRIVKTDDQ